MRRSKTPKQLYVLTYLRPTLPCSPQLQRTHTCAKNNSPSALCNHAKYFCIIAKRSLPTKNASQRQTKIVHSTRSIFAPPQKWAAATSACLVVYHPALHPSPPHLKPPRCKQHTLTLQSTYHGIPRSIQLQQPWFVSVPQQASSRSTTRRAVHAMQHHSTIVPRYAHTKAPPHSVRTGDKNTHPASNGQQTQPHCGLRDSQRP